MDQSTNSLYMDDSYIDIQSLFKMWDLSDELCLLLKEHGMVSFTILKKMEVEDIFTLFGQFNKKFYLELYKFKAGLKEWRNCMKIPLDCESMMPSVYRQILDLLQTISLNLSDSRELTHSAQLPPFATINKNRLLNMLNTTVKGQLVLTFNEKYGYLDTKSQNTISRCIVDSYVGSSVKMTHAEMQKWANVICEVFPKENPETYYLSRKRNKKNRTGKIFSRWTNADKVSLTTKTVSENTEIIASISSDEYWERKCWLHYNSSPWKQVILYWKQTSQLRVAEIKKLYSLHAVLKEWPRYNHYCGYDLVEIDFDSLYPGKGNLLFLKLERFYSKIFDIFEKELRDRTSRDLYVKYLYNANISNDTKYYITTILLHALLPPDRLNKKEKPTIADGQNDFVTLVSTPNEIQPKITDIINNFAERKEKLQPRIIAVGTDITNISDFYIFCDGIKWKCSSYMKCVDIIIKLSYVFNAEYSQRSKKVWAFLEQYFFEIKSEDFSSVANLLSKLV